MKSSGNCWFWEGKGHAGSITLCRRKKINTFSLSLSLSFSLSLSLSLSLWLYQIIPFGKCVHHGRKIRLDQFIYRTRYILNTNIMYWTLQQSGNRCVGFVQNLICRNTQFGRKSASGYDHNRLFPSLSYIDPSPSSKLYLFERSSWHGLFRF